MIPNMIVYGLLLGRWWRVAIISAAFVWPLMLMLFDVPISREGLLGAAFLGAANASAGVLVHQGVLWLVRRLRAGRQRRTTSDDRTSR